MIKNSGCYNPDKLNNCSFMKNDIITLDSIISSEIPLKDKYWFVIRKTDLTIDEKHKIAIDVAEIVLPIYEAKYPDSVAPREAIEAAKQYLGGHISLGNLQIKKNAATTAAAAATAATAAYAAATATAYAATATAAATAAYAADAAATAAYAADADAYAADAAAKLETYLINLCK